MFISPRFVVVDDNPDHLTAVLDVFQKLGTPCLGITYDSERELDKRNFEGVRALFLDLHLTDLVATTDENRHFAVIGSFLEDNISPTGGPFILVVWTEHEDSVEGLRAYLDDPRAIDPGKPHARPLAIMSLPKSRFINVSTGEPRAGKADALRDAVEATVGEKPQLAALLSWEADVQAAAGATLATLFELVPDDKRNSASFSGGIDEILSRLAREAVGQPHVATDPRAAIMSALAPILADRIVNQQASEATSRVWDEALTWNGQGKLDTVASGKVNRMLHVAVPPSEAIGPADWGAVVEFPDAWWRDDELRGRFGVTPDQLLGDEYKLKADDQQKCRPRLIRIAAACDYAQNRSGPLTYLFGLEIPVKVRRNGKPPASVWSSPTLVVKPDDGPFVLAVNARYSLNVVPADAEAWQPVYRFREQLLMHLISHASSYLARPGIVQL